jgi:hypothetical protein
MPSLQQTFDLTPQTTPATASAMGDLIDSINTLITTYTNWRVQAIDGASPKKYINLAPPLGSPMEKMRVLIAGDVTTPPNGAQVNSPHTAVATNQCYVGVGVAATAGATAPDNAWDSASAQFTAFWSKYVRGPTTTHWDRVWLVVSDDILELWTYKTSDDTVRGFRVGAIGIAPTTGTGHQGTTRRILGVMTTGTYSISNDWHYEVSTSVAYWMNFANEDTVGNRVAQPLCFIIHPLTGVATRCERRSGIFTGEPEGSGDPLTATNLEWSTPGAFPRRFFDTIALHGYANLGPNIRFGWFRQFYMYGKGLAGQVVRDSSNNVVGYLTSGSRATAYPATITSDQVMLTGIEDAVE